MASRLKYYPNGIQDEETFRRAVRDYFHTQGDMCALEGAWHDISVHVFKLERILKDHSGSDPIIDKIKEEIKSIKATLDDFVKESEQEHDDLIDFSDMIRKYKPDYNFEIKIVDPCSRNTIPSQQLEKE